jgi:hypothetical protein
MSKTIKFSMHKECIGKPEKRIRKVIENGKEKEYTDLYVGNTRINLGFDWVNTEANVSDVFELLTVDGYAIAPYLTNDAGGNRKIQTFAECGLALVDIDEGMTINQLLNHPFYNTYGAGYYTTASHTNAAHRFRILHILETPITDEKQMRAVYKGLMAAYGEGDKSCNDASRLFYGTTNASWKQLTDRILPVEVVSEMIIDFAVKEKSYFSPSINTGPLQGDPDEMHYLLGRISNKYFSLVYNDWLKVSWAVAGVVGVTRAKAVMQSYYPEREPGDYNNVFKGYDINRPRKPGMGTLRDYAKG